MQLLLQAGPFRSRSCLQHHLEVSAASGWFSCRGVRGIPQTVPLCLGSYFCLVQFKVVLSLGKKRLGFYQRLQLSPFKYKELILAQAKGKADRADTLQEVPGHGVSSKPG